MSFLKFIKNHFLELFVFTSFFLFSFWLMFSTFSYKNGEILVASKAWSDFGSHLPLIRSFSFGWNFPIQYPLFPGEPIHYHFLFYAFVGLLERLGLQIDYALNIPSALGYFLLLVMLYTFGKMLFKSKAVGILGAIFFIFNGSFSFLYFLKLHAFDNTFISAVKTNTTFPSFHPYGDGLVSAFWNLNIYTNQRHLAAAFAFSLFVLFLFLLPVFKTKKYNSVTLSVFLGILLGSSYFFHIAAFGMTSIAILVLLIISPKIRLSGILILLIASIIFYPQYLYMNGTSTAFHTVLNIGYLTPPPVNIYSFMNYWSLNLGLHLVLIPVGFILAGKNAKKIFIAFFAFFIIGNTFQFSSEMAANHKFFNYFMLIGSMFSGYALLILWKKSIILKPIAVLLFFLLIFSGIIDFFPIYNDGKVTVKDYKKDPDIMWIMKNTPQDSVFLNTTYFVPIESLAGRKVYFGWPYFAWSQGYDTSKRGGFIDNLFLQADKKTICKLLHSQNLSFIRTSEPVDTAFPQINKDFFASLTPVYTNSNSHVKIYDVAKNCENL